MTVDMADFNLQAASGGTIRLRSKNSPEILVKVKGPPLDPTNGFVVTPSGDKEFDLLDAVFCTEKEAKENVCEKNELLSVNFYKSGALVHSVRMSPRAPIQVDNARIQPLSSPTAPAATAE